MVDTEDCQNGVKSLIEFHEDIVQLSGQLYLHTKDEDTLLVHFRKVPICLRVVYLFCCLAT